jgi:hypothetical protein
MTDYDNMSGPDLAAAYNAMAKTLGRGQVKKFRTLADGVKRCRELSALSARKNSKAKFGVDTRIQVVNGNPRREGTKAHSLYEKMASFVINNPNAPLAEVMAETGYRRQDFDWDRDRGNIKVV